MKKKIQKKLTEIFILLDINYNYQGTYNTFDEAKMDADKDEMSNAIILKVVKAWELDYPEDPAIQAFDLSLENVSLV